MSLVSAPSYCNVVSGELDEATTDEVEAVLNPATEEPIANVPRGGKLDVSRAVDAHTDKFVDLEIRNEGKPRAAAVDEITLCSDHLRFFAGAARLLDGKATGEYLEG